MFFFLSPLAEMALPLDDYSFIDHLWRDWSPGYDGTWDVARVKESIGDPERIVAAIGYYRALYDPQLQVPELDALVRLGVGPQCHTELSGTLRHMVQVMLHDVEVEQQRRGLEIVHVLPHDMELGLAPQDPAHLAVRAQCGVLLLRGAHRLVAPLGYGGRGLQLDRCCRDSPDDACDICLELVGQLLFARRALATIDKPPPINPSHRKSTTFSNQMEFCYG